MSITYSGEIEFESEEAALAAFEEAASLATEEDEAFGERLQAEEAWCQLYGDSVIIEIEFHENGPGLAALECLVESLMTAAVGGELRSWGDDGDVHLHAIGGE